jgi:PAS domain S-box-containing protein
MRRPNGANGQNADHVFRTESNCASYVLIFVANAGLANFLDRICKAVFFGAPCGNHGSQRHRSVTIPIDVVVDTSECSLAEEKFRLAVEACPSGMVMIDHNGNMVMVNAEIERQFGYRREELIGHPADMLVPERLRSRAAHRQEAFGRQPESRRLGAGPDLFGLRKDGSEFFVEIGLTPIPTGEDVLVLAVIVDVSERRRAERLKDEFVATVSHELRTPLTSIYGSLGLLMGRWGGALPEPAARMLMIAHQNSQRLVRLINDILDIEKIESGRVVFKSSRVDVHSLVEQAIEASRGFAEGYGVRVRLDSALVDGEVNVDPDRLVQVVTNLLSNAIKFSPADKDVLVTIEKNADVVRISVRDHGSGIPADFKPYIFEKFAQADATSSRQKGGTGLGLSIVKQIAERLGGGVGFADAPGGGTIFHVELPAWDRSIGWDIDLEAEAGAARILLCEDDHDTAAIMRDRLRQAGFAADVAYTMAAALARADATIYAAILVDLQLPDGDGIGLMAQLRALAQYHDTPIIVASGNAGLGRADARSLTLNVLGWLSKPVDFPHLAHVLKTSIASKSNEHPPAAVRTYIQPSNGQLDSMRELFLQRANGDAVALATHRAALRNGTTVPATLSGIRDIAHGLAGAGGIFGYCEIGDAAAALEEAVIAQLGGAETVEGIASALDRLLTHVDTNSSFSPAPSHAPLDV